MPEGTAQVGATASIYKMIERAENVVTILPSQLRSNGVVDYALYILSEADGSSAFPPSP